MTPSFHDGFLDGIMLSDETTVHLYLRTATGERHTLVARGVEHLRVDEFRLGNIVFEIEVLAAEHIPESYLSRVYDLSLVELAGQKEQLTEMIRRRSLQLVVLSPSYGAECLLLTENWSIEPVTP